MSSSRHPVELPDQFSLSVFACKLAEGVTEHSLRVIVVVTTVCRLVRLVADKPRIKMRHHIASLRPLPCPTAASRDETLQMRSHA
jgi:hypothetical protein